MHKVTSAPVTAAVFAAMTILLYGCMAYNAAGDIVTAPFGISAKDAK